MTKPKFAWSYSSLSDYELCPHKWAEVRYFKRVPYVQNVQAAAGDSDHKSFENFILGKRPLPTRLESWTNKLDPLRKAKAVKHPELELAINRDLKPVGWWAPGAWGRAKLDLFMVVPKRREALLFDWKFGKWKANSRFMQLHIAAWMLQLHVPKLRRTTAALVWAQHKSIETVNYSAETMGNYQRAILERVGAMERAVEREDFPPKENFLCRKHCPVKSCKFNGG